MAFESLEPRNLLAASAVISEFLASNSAGIVDQDGNHSDWIEIQNTTTSALNIGGWYLTNDASNPVKWQFPSTTIAAGGFLTVFASGKDRHVSGQELHTNFSLDATGGYLALEMPDQSIASSFAPYPAQITDVSYGITGTSTDTDALVDEDAPLKYLVPPTTSTIASTWTSASFDDSTWTAGQSAVGYDTAPTASADYLTFINTNVGSQMNVSPQRNAAFIRYSFLLANPSQLTSLSLQLRYDDGFVAYLNGTEVARANFTGTPAPTSSASSSHTDSQAAVYQTFNVSSFLNKLVAGNNVLAIAGLNRSTDTSDFLIDPLLSANRVNPPILGFMATPTPGAANNPGSLGFVADTKFSVDRGFYTSPFDVQITTATTGAQIRYTLDGSAPTATTGLLYAGPIHISNTTNLRAAAFKTGYTPTDVDTEAYLFLNSVIHQSGTGLPDYATWGHAGPDWAMDPNIVNSPTYSSQIIPALQAIPTMSITLPWQELFGPDGLGIYISGDGVPEASSTEYFTADGSKEFQINDSVQIQGGTSDARWKQDKISFRLKFSSDYGPTKLDFPLFTDPTFDQGATTSFDTLILDSESNDTWVHPDATQRSRETMVQDQFVADLENQAGGYAPHGTYVQLYLDGLYWGVYYVHERPDASFASAYLGGSKDDYDGIKHNPTTPLNNSTTAVPDYASFLALVRQNMTVQANYQAVANQLDTKNLIDYMIVNYYVGNTDWASASAQHNWYASYDKVSGTGQWRFHSWDAEHVFENLSDNETSNLQTGGPTEIFLDLMANPEFKLQFADEVQRLMFNGGLLTPQVVGNLFSQRASELNLAIVGESARWGDNWTPGTPYTADQRNANVQTLLTNYFPQRTQVVINQFIAKGWLPSLIAPLFSSYGGTVNPGFQVSLSLPTGAPAGAAIYFTLDGSDPRVTGGAISSSANLYSNAITINAAGHLKARVRDSSGNWSPLIDAVFLLTTPFPVRIVEMNYHPADRAGVTDPEDMEFIELLNTGTQAVDLNGLKIDRGVTYQFTSSLMLGAGQRIVIAHTPAVFQQVYGTGINLAPGGYSGKLDNSGEEVRLVGALGEVLQDFTYDDNDPWPSRADGKGSSLEIINLLGDPTDPTNWRSSYEYGGSPGVAGLGPVNRVVINEVLTREDSPQVDAIELLNTTAASINIGGWYLSDTSDNYKKYLIPTGTIIGAGQYLVIDATAFDPAVPTGGNVPFGLSGTLDDDVWLLSADASGNLLDFENHVNLVASADNVSFGRWPNGTGDLYPMKSVTLGAANSGPLIGPVVFSEVMYSPPGNNPDLQFVELTNVTTQTVALSNTIAGVGAAPWEIDGLGFSFPLGTTIAPRASMVVVDFDPTLAANATKLATFRSTYGIGSDAQIVSGWTGTLDRPSDDLKLLRPDTPASDNPTFVPYVLIDEVNYSSSAPWTSAANQQSTTSLTRNLTSIYGDEPTNWVGAPASPGKSDLAALNLVHGDFSFDGTVGPSDVRAMLTALADVPGFEAAHGLTDADWRFIGDMNGDHVVNNLDLQALLTLLVTSAGGGGAGSSGGENINDVGGVLTATASAVSPAVAPVAEVVVSLEPSMSGSDSDIVGSSVVTISPPAIVQVNTAVNSAQAPAIAADEMPHRWAFPAELVAPTEPNHRAAVSIVDQAIDNFSLSRSRHSHRDASGEPADALDDLFAAWA